MSRLDRYLPAASRLGDNTSRLAQYLPMPPNLDIVQITFEESLEWRFQAQMPAAILWFEKRPRFGTDTTFEERIQEMQDGYLEVLRNLAGLEEEGVKHPRYVPSKRTEWYKIALLEMQMTYQIIEYAQKQKIEFDLQDFAGDFLEG